MPRAKRVKTAGYRTAGVSELVYGQRCVTGSETAARFPHLSEVARCETIPDERGGGRRAMASGLMRLL